MNLSSHLIRRVAIATLCLWWWCPSTAAAQTQPDVRVASIRFSGNETFDSGRLRTVMQTRQAGRWPWSDWIPFDQRRLDADLERLRAFYHDSGFPDASVRIGNLSLSDDGRSVRIGIVIVEGPPQLIDRVDVLGLEALPAEARPSPEDIPLHAGDRRDRTNLIAAQNLVLGAFRDNGYPYVRVDIDEADRDDGTVGLTLRAEPGPETRYGDLSVVGLKRLKQVVVSRAITFRPGDLYREVDVQKSQRRLAALQAFEFVNLTPDSTARDQQAEVLPMKVTVAEARPYRIEVRAGYGTEDRLRGAVEWRNLNFFGNASQLVANAKYSTVLRGGGFGYEHPYLLPSGGSLSARAGAWWTYESAFTSRSAGGEVTLRHDFGRTWRGALGVISGWEGGVTYRNERLRYEVKADALEDLGTVEERIALGLDPVTGRGDGTVAAIELDVNRTSLDTPADPTRGTTLGVHLSHVAPWLGGTFRYDEVLGEARAYVPITGRWRLATKLRLGTILTADSSRMPFSARYFLGGSSSVRGWGRFEISPTSAAGVPIGGRTVLDTSAEVRFPIWDVIGGVVFFDAGQVWPDQGEIHLSDIRYATGAGLRWQSLIGIVRADVGYQLNPIADLRIDRQLQTRRWRIHLSIGHAF